MRPWKYIGAYISQTNDQVALRVSNDKGTTINFYHDNFMEGYEQNGDIALELVPMVPDQILRMGFQNYYPADEQLETFLSGNRVPESSRLWRGIRRKKAKPLTVPITQERVGQAVESVLSQFPELDLRQRSGPLRLGNVNAQEYNTWFVRLWLGDRGLDFQLTLPLENPEEYVRSELERRLIQQLAKDSKWSKIHRHLCE